ncbi:HAD-like domain-containing protein [Parasitella parasitica]|nr:HAD-like domain-containing protein [Parasitella parasitica]
MSFVRQLFSKKAMQNFKSQVDAGKASAYPLLLIDFDQTITLQDTIGPLGKFGVSYTQNSKPWSYFVDSYLQEYKEHRKHLPKLPKGDFKAFVKQLDSYRSIERASQERVGQYKVFQGITRQALTEQASLLRAEYLQPGVVDTLQEYKGQIRIISLNWSKDWILGFLKELGLSKNHIFSNDLEFDDSGKCTGRIIPAILTTGDKQAVIDTFRQQFNETIYIGDSLGDIEALIEADLGIIIGNDKSLLDSLADFGHETEHDMKKPSSLYRADNWDQIKSLIQEHRSI